MLSDERQSVHSLATSRSSSYRDGTASRSSYQQRPSIAEENEEMYYEYDTALNVSDQQEKSDRPPLPKEDPYLSALRYRFPNRSRGDYVYSKPASSIGIFN